MICAMIRNVSGVDVEPGTNSLMTCCAAEIGEHRGEGRTSRRTASRPSPSRAHRQVDRFLQPVPGQRAVGGGQHEPAQRADGRGLGGRRQTEQDGAQHREDQHRQREEGRQQHQDDARTDTSPTSSLLGFGARCGCSMARATHVDRRRGPPAASRGAGRRHTAGRPRRPTSPRRRSA